MANFVARQGNVSVSLDRDQAKFVSQAIEAALPGVRLAIHTEVQAIMDNAHAEWPVGKARKALHSRDALEIRETVDLDRATYTASIRNDVKYAPYVKPRKWHGATTAWQRLVRGPMAALAKKLTTTLGPAITAAIRANLKGAT